MTSLRRGRRPLAAARSARAPDHRRRTVGPARSAHDQIFLSVPFDRQYEPLLLALVNALTARGTADPAASAATQVFLNVPFDQEYERLLLALIATLTALGAIPRSAVETTQRGRSRLNRLMDLLRLCPASIHDLSRVQGTRIGNSTVPRFNMPFEPGSPFSGPRHPANTTSSCSRSVEITSRRVSAT